MVLTSKLPFFGRGGNNFVTSMKVFCMALSSSSSCSLGPSRSSVNGDLRRLRLTGPSVAFVSSSTPEVVLEVVPEVVSSVSAVVAVAVDCLYLIL